MNATNLTEQHQKQNSFQCNSKRNSLYLDSLTLRIHNSQAEVIYQEILLQFLFLFVEFLLIEKLILKPSTAHIAIAIINLFVYLLIALFAKKPSILYLQQLNYFIALFIYIFFEVHKYQYSSDSRENIHLFWNYSFLIFLSALTLPNWIFSMIFFLVVNIAIYLQFNVQFFSIIQILSFIYPLFFYFNLRREKLLFAKQNIEFINIIEQVLPIGLIIFKKNVVKQVQQSLFSQLVSYFKKRNTNVCCNKIKSIFNCPFNLFKSIQKRIKNRKANNRRQNQNITSDQQFNNIILNQNQTQQQNLTSQQQFLTNRQIGFGAEENNIGCNNLVQKNQQQLYASESTYTSSLQSMFGTSDFSILYCNKFFINHFTNTLNFYNSSEYISHLQPFFQQLNLQFPLSSPHKLFSQKFSPQIFQHDIQTTLQNSQTNSLVSIQFYIIQQIIKSLKQMNLSQQNTQESKKEGQNNQDQQNQNTSNYNQIKTYFSQMNIPQNKIEKLMQPILKASIDTPLSQKQQSSIGYNLSQQIQPLSPNNDDLNIFSNINLPQILKTDSKYMTSNNGVNQNTNSNNNTVIFSSKNILSPDEQDLNKQMGSQKNILINHQYQQQTHINKNIKNCNKSRFININPLSISKSDDDQRSNSINNNTKVQQTPQLSQYAQTIQDSPLKQNKTSIIVLDGEADKQDETLNKNKISEIHTVYEYIKQRLLNSEKLKKNNKYNSYQKQFDVTDKNMNKSSQRDIQIDEKYNQEVQIQKDEIQNEDEEEQESETINCYQIDEKSDMKKNFSVQLIDGEWIGDQALFCIVNKYCANRDNMLQDKLKEVETFKSSLLKTVSHELKSPLNGITVYLKDIIDYFKTKLKSVHGKVQKQNILLNNSQSLAYIQQNANNDVMSINLGSSQNIPPVNGVVQNQNIQLKSGAIEIPKSTKIFTLNSGLNLKEKKSQILKYITDLHNIDTSTKILTSVIDDILDYSAIKINNFRLNTDQFDIRSFLVEIKELFQKRFEQKKLNLYLEFPTQDNSSIMINNDQKRIKQILINILSNSLKYTNKGFCKIILQKDESNSSIFYISVKDTGKGMDVKTQNKLFQLFENPDGDIHGIGLGLVISRNLVGFLGPSQEIDVESEEGKGSTFRFAIYTQNSSQIRNQIKQDLYIPDIKINSGANQFKCQRKLSFSKIKDSNIRVYRDNLTPQNNPTYGNKLQIQRFPTQERNKKVYMHHSLQNLDKQPKRSLKVNNIQMLVNTYENIDFDNNSDQAKTTKNHQDSPLDVVDYNSNKEVSVSIVLPEEVNTQNKNTITQQNSQQNILPSSQQNIQSLHYIYPPSERLIRKKEDFVTNQKRYSYQNISEIEQNNPKQQNHNRQLLNDKKRQFIQNLQQINNQLESLESINCEETPYSNQRPRSNVNCFDDNNNSNGNNQEIRNRNNQNILNEIKNYQNSQSYDMSSQNEYNEGINENSQVEYYSIDQEQYQIPEFDHHQNDLQTHYIQLPNKKILIVEDSHFNQLILERLLKNINGIELIDKADNGEIALQKIHELYLQSGITYDLILMDWNMPVIDGLQATQLIRQLTFLENNPPYIIFVTASSAQEKETLLNAGANSFIEKPVNGKIFYDEYNKFLEYGYLQFYSQRHLKLQM